MTVRKLEKLAHRLRDQDSLRELFSALNFDFEDESVNKYNWKQDQKDMVTEARIIARKSNYHVCYIRVNNGSLKDWTGISSSIIKDYSGLCMVCTHNPDGFGWVFSGSSGNFTEQWHVQVSIIPDSKMAKAFVDFLESIKIQGEFTTASITTGIYDSLGSLVVRISDMMHSPCINAFVTKCHAIIDRMDPGDTVRAHKLVMLALRVGQKYPFVSLPDFFQDFMSGMYTRKIYQKYSMRPMDYDYLIKHVLKIPIARSKSHYNGSLKTNLQNPELRQQYDLVVSYAQVFDDAFTAMLNCNILQALLAYTILDHVSLDRLDIPENVLVTYNKIKDKIPILDNSDRRSSFESYIDSEIDLKLRDITEYL